MIVICLEGSHGSGKTSLLSRLQSAGFNVLDEAFINQPSYTQDLHPQSLTMESMWVCRWFERLLKKKSEVDKSNEGDTIFFADRSPYSAVFYSKGNKGKLLAPVIQQQIVELQESANIEVITVYVKVQPDVLWSRIQERLRREPAREQFSEDNVDWMKQTLQFYDGFTWDCTVDNSHAPVERVMESLVSTVSRHSKRFRRIVAADGIDADISADDVHELDARGESPLPGNFTPRVRAASRQCLNDVPCFSLVDGVPVAMEAGGAMESSPESSADSSSDKDATPNQTKSRPRIHSSPDMLRQPVFTPEGQSKTKPRMFTPASITASITMFDKEPETDGSD